MTTSKGMDAAAQGCSSSCPFAKRCKFDIKFLVNEPGPRLYCSPQLSVMRMNPIAKVSVVNSKLPTRSRVKPAD